MVKYTVLMCSCQGWHSKIDAKMYIIPYKIYQITYHTLCIVRCTLFSYLCRIIKH